MDLAMLTSNAQFVGVEDVQTLKDETRRGKDAGFQHIEQSFADAVAEIGAGRQNKLKANVSVA